MSKKLVAFFFIVENSEGVIDLSAIQQRLANSSEKFAFAIVKKKC